jgi:hypothetical protein
VILALDPGSEQTAHVVYDEQLRAIVGMGIKANAETLTVVSGLARARDVRCVVEMVASYGMAVGREVFETVYWIGRFSEAWAQQRWLEFGEYTGAERLVRRDVKMHLCGNNAAKATNIRAALLDRFGPGKERAVGVKAKPGPLYGVKADCWAALALAVTYADRSEGTGVPEAPHAA